MEAQGGGGEGVVVRSDHGQLIVMPVGYRFMPTDEELVTHYLKNKVFSRPLPAADTIREIDATQFYSCHPKNLVSFSCGEREWFFFIHEDENCSDAQRRRIRAVGNGLGFWKPNGSENPIYNKDGNVFAFKIFLTYFSGSFKQAKRTHWKMEEYRFHFQSHTEEDYPLLCSAEYQKTMDIGANPKRNGLRTVIFENCRFWIS